MKRLRWIVFRKKNYSNWIIEKFNIFFLGERKQLRA